MEKRRMLKMTEIERNMLNRALTDRLNILHGEGKVINRCWNCLRKSTSLKTASCT